ncbi:hypothetical protein ABT121_43555 [Streptomyces sp. NPDC001928]|uniref:hypothetical protein n=1 Tax=Streptomyces sp. NPDC001928 TaxID=3154404 RepID=UPI0033270E71
MTTAVVIFFLVVVTGVLAVAARRSWLIMIPPLLLGLFLGSSPAGQSAREITVQVLSGAAGMFG